jgi:hypothetical protein
LNIFAHPLEIAIYSPAIVVFIEKLGRDTTADFNRPIIVPLTLVGSLFCNTTHIQNLLQFYAGTKEYSSFFEEHKFLYRFSVSTLNAVGGSQIHFYDGGLLMLH